MAGVGRLGCSAEVHAFDEVKRREWLKQAGNAVRAELFLGVPHLLLTEHDWDEEAPDQLNKVLAIEGKRPNHLFQQPDDGMAR